MLYTKTQSIHSCYAQQCQWQKATLRAYQLMSWALITEWVPNIWELGDLRWSSC